MTATSTRSRTPIEMTNDAAFSRRVRRLVVISLVALGAIWALALATTEAPLVADLLLAAGWIGMPTLLLASLERPRLRFLLTAPAISVTVGLVMVALQSGMEGLALAGWWLTSAGVGVGGALGTWFWFRWIPVPRELDQPFSSGRWALIGLHAALVVAGIALVVAVEFF